jgi:hypothetical protein
MPCLFLAVTALLVCNGVLDRDKSFSRAKLLNTHHKSRGRESSISVLQLVFCTAADFEWRKLHRETWIQEAKKAELFSPYSGHRKIRVLLDVRFVIGSLDIPSGKEVLDLRSKVLHENATTGDIVSLRGMKENMNRGKTHAAYLWANTHFPNVDYFGKSDTDTYLFYPAIVSLLPTDGRTRPIFLGQSHPTKEKVQIAIKQYNRLP